MARFRESTDRSETTMQLELERYVPGLLLWLSNKVSSSASLLYNEKFGVGVTEWRVLAYFNIYPWSTASKASELMGALCRFVWNATAQPATALER